MGFEPRRRVQFAGGRWRCNLPQAHPYPTLPISQANTLARDCFSDISRPCNYLLRCCAQGPERPHANRTAVHGSFAVGRPLAAGMKRHRPGTTVYLERRATGSLADLHLHLHAGPLPVGRWLAVLAQLVYGRR